MTGKAILKKVGAWFYVEGASRQSLIGLDSLNFFLADVRAGVGPFLATYLLADLHWNPAKIGVVMSIMGIASLLAETPWDGHRGHIFICHYFIDKPP